MWVPWWLVDDLDLEIINEWLNVARMVTDYSEKVRADIARVLENWMTIDDDEAREQGLREMESIFVEALAEIRRSLQ